MASQVKVEPPDVEGDAAFGMNGHSPFLEGYADPFMGMVNDDEIKNEDDPFGYEALLRSHKDEYDMEYEDENGMEYGRNGDLVHDPFDNLMGLNDEEEMRRRKEAEINSPEPLETTTPLVADNHSVQDKRVNNVYARLPRGNYIPYDCVENDPNKAKEPPTDNVPEKEQPQGNLYDDIKKKTRRQSMKVVESIKADTVVKKKKRGRKSTVVKKVAGARKSTPRNVIGVVAPAKRGRPKGSKDKPKEVSNPHVQSAMDEGYAPMGNSIIDPALVRRRPRLTGGTGKATYPTGAANSSESQSSLLPWNGSVNSSSHPFHRSFDYSTIDRSNPATVSHSVPNFHQMVGRPYTEGLTSTTISQWGVHSTTVSHSTPNVKHPIADHTYTAWPHPPNSKKPVTGKASTRKMGGPPRALAAHIGQPNASIISIKPPAIPSIHVPYGNESGGVVVVDPRRGRQTGEEEMGRMREEQNGMETAMAFYDPRRVQRKSIESDFAPHPIDEGDKFRVVCGPIPEKKVSLDVIRERVLSLCRPFDYKFTRFEGNYYMWLRFTVEREAHDLVQSRPFRLGLFSGVFNRPGTITVDTNEPMGDYYLLAVLTKYGLVTGVEKIGEFKWKATFLEEIEAMTVINVKLERVEKYTLTYSSYTPSPRVEIESPASPPYQCEDDTAPASASPIIVPTHPVAPILRSRPIQIPTDDHYDNNKDDHQMPAGTDAHSFSATMADTPASPDSPGTSMVPYADPLVRAVGRTKGALVPRTAGTIAAAPHHHSGYKVQPYEGHMAHVVPAAPGGARGVVPSTGQGRGMVMVRSTMETAIERMKKMGEGLAIFPLVLEDDVKECMVGMKAWTNHIVLGPMPSVYNEDQMRRAYQIHHEIGLRMIGCFMHLFIAEDASHEVKLHLWRIQNCNEGVMTDIPKGIPRSIIVKGTSMFCTAQSVKDYFESEFGRVVSVNEEHERMTKIFAVNFMHRKEAASAHNTQIHFALVDGEPFVLCEVVRN